ncbi:hypothetical protein PILCRDRAFT_7616 [Piloderma croceum F 1598]|uniref:Uncharacterized protein n=1 Tax=Piloderma croceum (strain F 1598) TaxID=765440 RepID=A0A0C3FSR1_PILCF|nr:hypothetical protein PILCRDRAFT_7616 [Piloderma croceum F 1598]
MAIADSIDVDFSSVRHNQSEYKNVMAQDKAELFNGIAGHRFYDDSHPRRRVALAIMGSILGFIKFFITGHYWYTLTSTFSISISGTMLLVLADFAEVGIQALMTVQESMTTGFWMNTFVYFPAVLVAVIVLLPQFAMIKAVMRLECVVDSGWFLRLRHVPANHKERASERLDGRTSKTFRLAVTVHMLGSNILLLSASPALCHPCAHSPPAVEDFPTHKLRDLSPSVLIPLRLTGLIQQMLLNHRTRTFTGQHKLSVVISCIEWSLGSAIFIPAIVGRVRARQGLSSHDIIDTVALIVGVWQALTLTSVTQTQGQEEED